MPNQLTFDLAQPPATFAREDFLVAPGNRAALAWIDRWPDWPTPALALGGPRPRQKPSRPNLGGARPRRMIDGGELEGTSVADSPVLAEAAAAIVIEEADHAPEQALFHLYNPMANGAATCC